ncbi:MAG: zinc-dependent metalloprotease [Chloroflexi bacterium]|nr:zinc-dependent metalloprotease [Chloroflexota bacterium]
MAKGTLLLGAVSGRLLGTGIVLGVAAGAAWAAGKLIDESVSRDEAHNPRLINWSWARALAVRTAQRGEERAWAHGAEQRIARQEYTELVTRSADLVSEYTEIALPAPLTEVHVFDRAEWVDANLAQFRLMFAPLDEAYAHTIARVRRAAPVGVMGQVMLSAQMGVLLGYLARKVLGQYDLSLLGREPVAEGRLYFVEPNLAALEEHYRLPPQEFRAWIAMHEVTHAFEFEAHPWVRAHMNGLLTAYLRLLSDDLFGNEREAPAVLSTWANRIKNNLFEGGHVLELMMSRDQREIFRQLQALMALMEGYSNHVMQQVGARYLKDHELLKRTFESRARNRGPAEQLFIKLTGLDIKLEQYRLGERFCRQIVDAKGIHFMNRAWRGPERLPTLDEIYEPDRWIRRQEAVAV